jgi:hypothetical protein
MESQNKSNFISVNGLSRVQQSDLESKLLVIETTLNKHFEGVSKIAQVSNLTKSLTDVNNLMENYHSINKNFKNMDDLNNKFGIYISSQAKRLKYLSSMLIEEYE